MKKTIKGVLLSGLVFPGLGQLFLGKKELGAGLILVTNIGLAGVVYSIFKRILMIMTQMQPDFEQGIFDFRRLIDLTLQSSSQANQVLDTISVTLITGCWIVSVGHAYWLGRQQDTDHHPKPQ